MRNRRQLSFACPCKKQLHLYVDLTIHEQAFSVTTRAETFSTAISHLAEQVQNAMEYAKALKCFIPER